MCGHHGAARRRVEKRAERADTLIPNRLLDPFISAYICCALVILGCWCLRIPLAVVRSLGTYFAFGTVFMQWHYVEVFLFLWLRRVARAQFHSWRRFLVLVLFRSTRRFPLEVVLCLGTRFVFGTDFKQWRSSGALIFRLTGCGATPVHQFHTWQLSSRAVVIYWSIRHTTLAVVRCLGTRFVLGRDFTQWRYPTRTWQRLPWQQQGWCARPCSQPVSLSDPS